MSCLNICDLSLLSSSSISSGLGAIGSGEVGGVVEAWGVGEVCGVGELCRVGEVEGVGEDGGVCGPHAGF